MAQKKPTKPPKAAKAREPLVPLGAEAYEDLFITEAADYDFENCETRADAIGPYNRRDVVAAIIYTRGVYSEMARLLGRKRGRVRDFVLKNPDIATILDEVKEITLDDLECGVFKSALNGDSTDRRFLLQTVGKNRGYSTRQEVTGEGGGPVSVLDVSKFSTSELKKLREAIITDN